MNLLFVCPTFYPHKGGAESLLDDLIALLCRRACGVTVITGTPAEGDRYRHRHGAEVIRVDDSPLFSLRLLAQYARIIRDCRIDTVCIGLFNLTAIYALILKPFLRFRLVIYLHGGETRNYQRKSRLFRWVYRWGLEQCDGLIAVSDDLGREATSLVPGSAGKLTVIPNAVPVQAIRDALPTGPDVRFFLFAGRLEPVKNVDCAIRAFAAAADQMSSLHFVIAGDGSCAADLKSLTEGLGIGHRVIFTGAIDRDAVYGLLKRAEFIVLPSKAEGHPIIVLEAFAAGKPVVASNVKGNRDLIVHRKNGFLFQCDNEKELSGLLIEVSRGTNIAGGLTDRFDIDASVDAHLRAYSR